MKKSGRNKILFNFINHLIDIKYKKIIQLFKSAINIQLKIIIFINIKNKY